MSAYLLDRDCFVRIARFIDQTGPIHVEHASIEGGYVSMKGNEAANILQQGNADSVNFRYPDLNQEVLEITEKHMLAAARIPAAKIGGIVRSLRYQSCEIPDYTKSLQWAVLDALAWMVLAEATKEAGGEGWA